jgi:hypothetical protein
VETADDTSPASTQFNRIVSDSVKKRAADWVAFAKEVVKTVGARRQALIDRISQKV